MTKIMGILNLTSDSFYPGSRCLNVQEAVARALQIQAEGADILDIGGESTRPGADPISVEEEIQRVVPVLKALSGLISIPISIDTRHVEVAAKAVDYGASIINDITGFVDPFMRRLARSAGCRIVVMHMQGLPKSMQVSPVYPEGVVKGVISFLQQQINLLLDEGMNADAIILDPGIGFGKKLEDNLDLIVHVEQLQALGFPLLYGISRKTFIRGLSNTTVDQSLPPTLALDSFLIMKRVDIIRVHDVLAHVQARKVLQEMSNRISYAITLNSM